jgi:hypothetical protein
MTLAFPNPSRSFDETRNAVLFFGYDGMFEIRFFVDAAVLGNRLSPVTKMSEAQYLSAFDTMLPTIHDVARGVYVSKHSNLNTLTTTDF